MWQWLTTSLFVNAADDKLSTGDSDSPTIYSIQRSALLDVVNKFAKVKSLFDQKRLTVDDRPGDKPYSSTEDAFFGGEGKFDNMGELSKLLKDKNGRDLPDGEKAKVILHLHNFVDNSYQNLYSWLESKEFIFEKDKLAEGGLITDPVTKQVIKLHPLESLALHDFKNEVKNALLPVNSFDMINNLETLAYGINALSALDNKRKTLEAVTKELKIAPAIRIADKNSQMSYIKNIETSVIEDKTDKGIINYAKKLNNYAHHFFTSPQSGNALVYGPVNFIVAMNIFGGASFAFNQTATFVSMYFDVFENQAMRTIKGFADPEAKVFRDRNGHQTPYVMAGNVVNDRATGKMTLTDQTFWKVKDHLLSDELNSLMKQKFGFEFDVYKEKQKGANFDEIKLTKSDVVRYIGYHTTIEAAQTFGPARHYDTLNDRVVKRFYELVVKSGLVAMPESFTKLEDGELFAKNAQGKYKSRVNVGSLDEAHFLCGIIATRHKELNLTYSEVFKHVASLGIINIERRELSFIDQPSDIKLNVDKNPSKPDPEVNPIDVATYRGQMNLTKHNIPDEPQRTLKTGKGLGALTSLVSKTFESATGITKSGFAKLVLAVAVLYIGYKGYEGIQNTNDGIVTELTGADFDKAKADLMKNTGQLENIRVANRTTKVIDKVDTISVNNERIFVLQPGTEIQFEKNTIQKKIFDNSRNEYKLRAIETNGNSVIFRYNGEEYEVSGKKGFMEKLLSENRRAELFKPEVELTMNTKQPLETNKQLAI